MATSPIKNESLRINDANATNPGDHLQDLFRRFGPCLILVDEWVAYARQLSRQQDADPLPAGTFDTHFTFAQALTEAAKAVKYGGTPEPEALQFVTANPARQLGIADRVGSLAPGKDADFVVWSGHPLSTYTVCEQTWIEGRRYFDRARDLQARAAMESERDMLLQKARAARKQEEASAGGAWKPSYLEDSNHVHSCAAEGQP